MARPRTCSVVSPAAMPATIAMAKAVRAKMKAMTLLGVLTKRTHRSQTPMMRTRPTRDPLHRLPL